MKKLSKRDKKVLYLGGGFAALVFLAFYVILPYYDSVAQIEEELSQKERMLTQSVRAIGSQEEYIAKLKALEGDLAQFRSQLLDTVDGTLAQNQLENLVRGIAEQNGVTISRSTPLQQSKVGERYAKVTVQINVQSGMTELTNFMEALSRHPKFLLVDDFYMNVFRVRNRMRLQPRMNVSAFIRLSDA